MAMQNSNRVFAGNASECAPKTPVLVFARSLNMRVLLDLPEEPWGIGEVLPDDQ